MLCKKLMFLLFAVHGFITTETVSRRPFRLIVNNVTCLKLNPIVKRISCVLKNFETSRYGLDSHFMLERAFEKNAEIHLLSFIEPVSAKKAIKFIDLKLKICDLLSTGISIAVGKVLLAEVRKTSNLPYECPLKGNVNYTFSNLSITAETLPTYTPFMKYNFSLITYDNKQMVAKFLLDGETVPK